MAPLELEGDTLGKKHKHYNKLVGEALKSNHLPQPIALSEDDDVQTLLKIDVACKNRNVDFILEVLKSEDQLHVSKAIKRSSWLFTDPQYAHIINPWHIYTVLYPQMTTKAFNKLMLNIRLHLKDENRVEAFYNYIKSNNVKSAHKWLQHCSIPFVEKEVANSKDDICLKILQRLFEKSFAIYETYFTRTTYYDLTLKNVFIVKKYPKELLDCLESFKDRLHYRFNQKGTRFIMQRCPERILNKFQLFAKCLHLGTFAKCLKKIEDIEHFLLKHADNKQLRWLYAYDKIKHFFNQMPKETRFELIKKVFIDKEAFNNTDENHKYKAITYCAANQLLNNRPQNTNIYMWYKFAPFEIAYPELKKLIRAESVPFLRNSMLQVLLSCAGRNTEHIQTVLNYYHDKHINEAFKFKIQFVNFFISKVDTHTLDDKSWIILCQLFHSMEVFIESKNNVQSCIKAIIVRSAIRNEQVPDIIERKFVFDTLKTYQTKLKKPEEKEAVFEYLYNLITTESNSLNLAVESEFNEAVTLIQLLLNLIKDWHKDLHEHAYAIDRIKELIKIRKEKHWSRDLTALYNTKKSWRKAMFEESIAILPIEFDRVKLFEKVCLNALKHDPGLLSRNKEQVLGMCCNNNISLRNLLMKMRIFWPQTLAEDWKIAYFKRLDQPSDHKALVVGLCTLLPHKQVNDILQKYAPPEKKIDWNDSDQVKLSLRKQIAKNVHKARPPPPVEGILLYAKGDYLQYAVPSMNAVLSQLSPDKSRLYIPMLLNAPVSLQKLGLRCAIRKLSLNELKPLLSEIWSSTKNLSIRTVLFTHTFQLLCIENNASCIKDTWDILRMFIENLTFDDNKLIFKKLSEVHRVPESIRPQFFIKSCTFLSSLPAEYNYEIILNNIQYMAIEFIEFLDDDFLIKVTFKNINNIFDIYRKKYIISSFILASKDEETQIKRYEKSLGIILEHYLPQWEMVFENKYHIKQEIKSILENLVCNMSTYTYVKKFHIPLKVFEKILWKLESILSYQKDYAILTTWKLATKYVKLLNENADILSDYQIKIESNMTEEEKTKLYIAIHEKISPLFAKDTIQYLKEDLVRFGTSTHTLFAVALKTFFHDYLTETMCPSEQRLLFEKCLLQCGNDREVYLMVYGIFVEEIRYYRFCKIYQEIYDVAMLHSSDEIKMYFYQAFA